MLRTEVDGRESSSGNAVAMRCSSGDIGSIPKIASKSIRIEALYRAASARLGRTGRHARRRNLGDVVRRRPNQSHYMSRPQIERCLARRQVLAAIVNPGGAADLAAGMVEVRSTICSETSSSAMPVAVDLRKS